MAQGALYIDVLQQIQHLSERLKRLEEKGMPFIRLNTVSVP